MNGVRPLRFIVILGCLLTLLTVSSSAAAKKRLLYDDLATGIQPSFSVISKWDHVNLAYGFANGTSDIPGTGEWQAVREAMSIWSAPPPLTFAETTPVSADIEISWGTGNHGDGFPFDGVNGVLAHAFPPLDGRTHFDDDETWTTATRASAAQPIDLLTVAAHELGHALGLGHSADPEALMYPYYTGSHRYLAQDDINGILSLYPAESPADLYAVQMNNTGEKHTGVHVLNGGSEYQMWNIQRETPLAETQPSQWQWLVGSSDGDSIPDLIGVQMNKTGEKHTGVHVLKGAGEYQNWGVQRETPLGETEVGQWQWATGDVNGDGIDDLAGIKMNGTGEKHTGIHILDGATEFQTWLVQRETPLGETSPTQWRWTMGDVNGDGIADLAGIKMNGTGEKHTGIHILDGATQYQTWLVQRETPLGETASSQWQWAMGDENGDGVADLYAIKMNGTGEKHTGIHILDGATQYQTWLTQRESPLPETSPEQWKFVGVPN